MASREPVDGFADYELADLNFPLFQHESLVSQCLTKDLYRKYFPLVSKMGVTIDKCIHEAVDQDGSLGLVGGFLAGDEETYDLFPELVHHVLEKKHGVKLIEDHPKSDLDASKIKNGQLDDKYVLTSRVRTGRNIRGFPFASMMNRGDRRRIEGIIVNALKKLDGELAGKYYPLLDMTKEDQDKLRAGHFLFQKPTSMTKTLSNCNHDWPDARGIFHNDKKTFLVWINEEDHSRVISMQPGGNLQETFARFCDGLKKVESLIEGEFMNHRRWGYITACPTNIGTAMRCSVHIQLKKLGESPRLDSICDALGLQKRGTNGGFSEVIDNVYDLSNKARLQKTETQFVQEVVDAIQMIVEIEKGMEQGKNVDDLIDQILPRELQVKAKTSQTKGQLKTCQAYQ